MAGRSSNFRNYEIVVATIMKAILKKTTVS